MIEPAVYLAYAPRGPGVMCALFFFAIDANVYGWYTGSDEGQYPSHFLVLENFYSLQETEFYRSIDNDVYGDWVRESVTIAMPVDLQSLVPADALHELERLQFLFATEWLFYPDDPGAAAEIEAYHSQELPVQPVNIRSRKLNKLDKTDVVWTYASPGLDLNVIDFLLLRWPLDYDTRNP